MLFTISFSICQVRIKNYFKAAHKNMCKTLNIVATLNKVKSYYHFESINEAMFKRRDEIWVTEKWKIKVSDDNEFF